MGCESSYVIRFDLGAPPSKSMRIAKLKSAYCSLIIDPRGYQCNTNLEVMGCGSFDVVGFDLGPLLQGQMRIAKLKVLITHLLLVLEVCNVKPTDRKSWAASLLMWSDLALGPSFKVKRG